MRFAPSWAWNGRSIHEQRMNTRATTAWFVIVLALVVVAMTIFRIKIAVLGAKYMIVLFAIVMLVAIFIPRQKK